MFFKTIFVLFNVLILLNVLVAYNLDTTHPIIISSLDDEESESYFGATVELFPRMDDSSSSWLVQSTHIL